MFARLRELIVSKLYPGALLIERGTVFQAGDAMNPRADRVVICGKWFKMLPYQHSLVAALRPEVECREAPDPGQEGWSIIACTFESSSFTEPVRVRAEY